MTTIAELAERIEMSAIGVQIAESHYAFAIIEGAHLIGLAASVGLIFLTDLRLMGIILRRVPVTDVLNHLRPYVLTGFALIFITGALLFWSAAARMIESPAFILKLFLIVLGGLNALYFEFVIAKREAVQSNPIVLPASARYAAAASLTIWTLVIVCGRLIPYIPDWGNHLAAASS
jgi:hypothetical protein